MNKLKELRTSKLLLQKDMAKFLNMSQTGYSQYENETRDIPTAILKKLSNYYNVSIDYILLNTSIKKKYKKSLITNGITRIKEIREDKDLKQIDIANFLNILVLVMQNMNYY